MLYTLYIIDGAPAVVTAAGFHQQGIGNVVKVGDFGMARTMASDGDYVILREKVPLALKWNSIEAMDSRFFSEASDCWSLGVLMWEILTYGEFPYVSVRTLSTRTKPMATRSWTLVKHLLRMRPCNHVPLDPASF